MHAYAEALIPIGGEPERGIRAHASNKAVSGRHPSGSNRDAARAASTEAISAGTGTFDPSNPRNGRNNPSSASAISSDRSNGGCTRYSNRTSVRHRKCRSSGVSDAYAACSYVGEIIVAT